MERPVNLSPDAEAYIDFLELRLSEIEKSPLHDSFLMYKENIDHMNTIAKKEGKTMSFADKDDKTFERVLKLMNEMRPILETYSWLEQQVGIIRQSDQKKKRAVIEEKFRK